MRNRSRGDKVTTTTKKGEKKGRTGKKESCMIIGIGDMEELRF